MNRLAAISVLVWGAAASIHLTNIASRGLDGFGLENEAGQSTGPCGGSSSGSTVTPLTTPTVRTNVSSPLHLELLQQEEGADIFVYGALGMNPTDFTAELYHHTASAGRFNISLDCESRQLTVVSKIPGYSTAPDTYGTIQVVQVPSGGTAKNYACADVTFSDTTPAPSPAGKTPSSAMGVVASLYVAVVAGAVLTL
ncbi:hypothetical protein HDU91_003425 [Kappamyces sp. JEL0680]|nr:hypothetical protein HDU91_003425 [Kappamyces sp. JEL0680]